MKGLKFFFVTPLHEKFRVQKCKVSDIFDLTIDIEVIRLGYGVYYRVDDSLKMQDPCVFILSSSPLTALEPSPWQLENARSLHFQAVIVWSWRVVGTQLLSQRRGSTESQTSEPVSGQRSFSCQLRSEYFFFELRARASPARGLVVFPALQNLQALLLLLLVLSCSFENPSQVNVHSAVSNEVNISHSRWERVLHPHETSCSTCVPLCVWVWVWVTRYIRFTARSSFLPLHGILHS